ncbi:MAG: PEP-CTERM sorting domain-containing protein [Akkermansiaceae bacterium]|nr:PEP-CTERM sorting domain-containing protein [Akkermansiaceae bacterium]
MKLKLFTAALALGLAASASADTTTVAYDEETQTVTTVATVTSTQNTVEASSAGVLSSASSATNWPETTVTFTLDLDALQSYVESGETGTLTLVSIKTTTVSGGSTTVGVGMSSDGTFVLLNGDSTWYTTSTTLNDLVSSGLTTLAVETGYASGTTITGSTASRPYTWLAATDADGSSVTTISNIVGLGSTGTSAYVSSVSVDSDYVTSFSVTNAPLSLDSAGVGAAAVALAAAVPEPATATLGLLALGALALRRRRA